MSEENQVPVSPEAQIPESTVPAEVLNPAENQSNSELKDAVADAVASGASEQEIKDLIKEYDLKVFGKSKKVKINLSNDEDVVRMLQKAEAGEISMREKAELEKFITNEILSGKKDPAKFLKEVLKVDPDEFAELRMKQKLEELAKSPEELEREKLLQEREEYRQKLEEIEKQRETEKMTALEQQVANEISSDITKALEEHKDLPKTSKTVGRIADALAWALTNGFPEATVQDVIPLVKDDIRKEIRNLMESMPAEFMEDYIGKASVEKLRKRRIEAATKVVPDTKVVPVVDQVKPKADPKTKKSIREIMKEL